MKKITIYVLSLNYGGAERVITNIANMLSKENQVTIKSVYKISEKPFFSLSENVKVEYLTNLKPNKDEFKTYIKNKKFIKAFKEGIKSLKILYMKKYIIIKSIKSDNSDVIFTTRKEHNYYLGKYGSKSAVKIGQEHNDFYNQKDINKVIKGAKGLDYFMPASLFLTKKYKVLLKDYPVKVKYIPHSIKEYNSKNLSKENQIIAVGRLETVKGFADLIDVFAKVHEKNKTVKLVIVGTGSLEDNLKDKVSNLNLNNYIDFEGYMNYEELQQEYEKSLFLVSTSYSESFGLVALEAANAEVCTVAFDSAEGLKEIIDESGILIENRDADKMSDTITKLLDEKQECLKRGKLAKDHAKKYYEENVQKKWTDFMNSLQ